MSDGLRFAAVDRRFGGRTALRGLELDCPRGELTCLVGPNGAGKSTALALGAGLLAPSAGAVSFDRQPVRPAVPPPSTGYLPQRSAFHPSLKVGEVVEFVVAARRAAGEERRRALAVTGLAGVLGRFVGELSGGWVRRLGLLAALTGEPQLLLLDEPFVGLDPETHDRLLAHLEVRLAEGATVVVASHDFESVDPFDPRVALLDDGLLIALQRVGRSENGDGFLTSREVYRRALAGKTAGGDEDPA